MSLTRVRTVVDDSALAQSIGSRLRAARLAAGLTQAQLAEGRYTKAYVSALEHGASKPSMAALSFFATRLGMPVEGLLRDANAAWNRLEVDLVLAAGRWVDAVDGYGALLETSSPGQRPEILVGLAEALVALGRNVEAARAAREAVDLFAAGSRSAEAALATYWLSASLHGQGNTTEAAMLLEGILRQVRSGLRVEPDFEFRLLAALSSNASRDGRHALAISYLEEVRGVAERLDDRRRASYLFNLAYAYREAGDYEGAIRAALQALPLYRAAHLDLEAAALENDLALSYLSVGNAAQAWELSSRSTAAFERLDDRAWQAHALETQSQIKLAADEVEAAAALAARAVTLADEAGDAKAQLNAHLSLGHAQGRAGKVHEALASFERAAELARQEGKPARIRQTLGEYADALAAAGEAARALEVLREAVRAD